MHVYKNINCIYIYTVYILSVSSAAARTSNKYQLNGFISFFGRVDWRDCMDSTQCSSPHHPKTHSKTKQRRH